MAPDTASNRGVDVQQAPLIIHGTLTMRSAFAWTTARELRSTAHDGGHRKQTDRQKGDRVIDNSRRTIGAMRVHASIHSNATRAPGNSDERHERAVEAPAFAAVRLREQAFRRSSPIRRRDLAQGVGL